ncbi:MAG: hypothetical protein ABIK75_07060 [candidate division WOR-3 bacterium]
MSEKEFVENLIKEKKIKELGMKERKKLLESIDPFLLFVEYPIILKHMEKDDYYLLADMRTFKIKDRETAMEIRRKLKEVV